MNVAIIGNGGREHAICTYIKKSNKIDKVYCIPGNAGTGHVATNVEIDIDNFKEIKKFIKKNNINLLIIGPEKPLVNGLVDYLKNINIKILDQIKKHHNSKGQKFLLRKFVKNIKFLQLILEYLKI